MVQRKKAPLRKCVGCGEMKEKRELIRVVKSPEGEISLDTVGRKAGRGAYVCPCLACLQAAQKSRRLERAFSCTIPADIYTRLEEELTAHE